MHAIRTNAGIEGQRVLHTLARERGATGNQRVLDRLAPQNGFWRVLHTLSHVGDRRLNSFLCDSSPF